MWRASKKRSTESCSAWKILAEESIKLRFIKKKLLFPGLFQIKLSLYEEIFLTRLNRTYTPHPLLPLSRSLHSFLLSILSPSWIICGAFLFMSCPYKRPPFSLCLCYPLYSFEQSRSHDKVPLSPPFQLFLRLHLNPLFLSQPITLNFVARLVYIIKYI